MKVPPPEVFTAISRPSRRSIELRAEIQADCENAIRDGDTWFRQRPQRRPARIDGKESKLEIVYAVGTRGAVAEFSLIGKLCRLGKYGQGSAEQNKQTSRRR